VIVNISLFAALLVGSNKHRLEDIFDVGWQSILHLALAITKSLSRQGKDRSALLERMKRGERLLLALRIAEKK
jgi:hypothetical protein